MDSDNLYFDVDFVGQYFRRESPHPKHFFVEVLHLFLSETDKRMKGLSQLIQDHAEIVPTLHYLKGSASQVGGKLFSSTLELAEETAKSNSTISTEEWARIWDVWQNTKRAIEKWLNAVENPQIST